MDTRDTLASVLRDAADAAIEAGLPVLTYDGYADAVIAGGWRPPARVLTDPAELDGLSGGSVIVDALDVARQLIDSSWQGTTSSALAAQQVPLPATLVYVAQ
jgi:hypothetical protein